MEQLPPLASLIAFDALYRTGTVTGAADLIGRTHSAVSKQLHQLQDHAGVELFRKQGTGLELTGEGRVFAGVVARALEDMRGGYEDLRKRGDHAAVTIAVSSTFAKLWAIPTISHFNLDHPEIDVLLRLVGPHGSRPAEDDVDLVLSWNRLLSDTSALPDVRTLGDVHIGPVLAPGYPHRLEDGVLRCATLIHRRGSERAWARWAELTDIRLEWEREVTFDLSALAFEAAARAVGVVIAPKFLVEQELKSGRLVPPAGFYVFREGFAVWPHDPRRKLSRNARIFFDWLSAHARLTPDGFIDEMPLPVSTSSQ